MDIQEKNILTKRFQTTMIGSLYEFEKAFGYLWGHEKEDHELTDQELQLLDVWDSVRNQILNNGNNQLRKAIVDLEKAAGNIRYNYRFYNKKKED